ncbi:MAG: VWA domain-containing protein [Phycisphaerales bacterium]|nr:VWA domain-containing protein [Phycisphaerales bacterium]
MTFSHPSLLLLLGVGVVLIVFAWQRMGPGLAMPFDDRTHKKRRFTDWTLRSFDCMPAIALMAAVCMLAGPQVLRRPTDQRVLTNIQFLMDVSGSMTVGRRYDMASDAITKFVDTRPGDAFGLTLFGSHAIRWVPLTRDLDVIRNAMAFADPQRQPRHMGGTRIGHALNFAMGSMVAEASEGDRMIVLVSDGVSSDLSGAAAAMDIADDLNANDITVYHVHVGTGSVPAVVQDLARETGGEAFVATNKRSLDNVFAHIDRLRPDRFERGGTVAVDWFAPFAITGLIAAGLHMIGLGGLRVTPW